MNTYTDSRRSSIEALRAYGIDPYGESFDTNMLLASARILVDTGVPGVSLSGRIFSKRVMGKITFVDINDTHESFQVFISRDEVGEDFYNIFKKHIQIGDIIGVTGKLMRTTAGEPSIRANRIVILGVATQPIPVGKHVDGESFHQVQDVEYLGRHRYVGWMTEPDALERLRERSNIIRCIREILDTGGYLEVETPILQQQYGGASARPFTTHHNALGEDLYLRIAPELYLKRMMISGVPGVYEIGKNFRNEGVGRFHNPEFTMLELYVSQRDYVWMMDYVDRILDRCALTVNNLNIFGDNVYAHRLYQSVARMSSPRLPFYRVLENAVGEPIKNHVDANNTEELTRIARAYDIEFTNISDVLDSLFSKLVEPELIYPTFIIDYPKIMSPLAKACVDDDTLVQRFELFIGGKEIANGFTELNDPVEQRIRFEEQNREFGNGIDEDYIHALEHGLPYCVGLGIGIDRLVMAITQSDSIRDVIAFPMVKNI